MPSPNHGVHQSTARTCNPTSDERFLRFSRRLQRAADKIHIESMVRARKLLESLPYSAPKDLSAPNDHFTGSKLYARKHQVVRQQFCAWVDEISTLGYKQVVELARLASERHYCVVGQEAQWACVEVRKILKQSLGRKLAAGDTKRELLPIKIVAEKSDEPFTLIEEWSRYVCDGEVGLSSKWCAPYWYEDFLHFESYRNGELPECLSEDEREGAVKSHQELFSKHLAETLQDAEDEAAALIGVTSKKNSRRGRPPSKSVATIREVIQRVSASGVRGEAYCSEMDQRGISTSIEWQKREGCPKSYRDAWTFRDSTRRRKFRRLITNQKSDATKASRAAAKIPSIALSD